MSTFDSPIRDLRQDWNSPKEETRWLVRGVAAFAAMLLLLLLQTLCAKKRPDSRERLWAQMGAVDDLDAPWDTTRHRHNTSLVAPNNRNNRSNSRSSDGAVFI